MPGILVGYARTSTCDQQAGLDAKPATSRRRAVRKYSPSRSPPWHSAIGSRKPCASSDGMIRSFAASRIALPEAPPTYCGSWTTLIAEASV